MTDLSPLLPLAREIMTRCTEARLTIATAEYCTGGLVAAVLTEIPGSSAVLDRGLVTYSNAAKSEMLGVPVWLIERHGAVSEDVARAMVGGALTHSRATLAVAITGIAGPSGGTAEKPVGLVWFGLASAGGTVVREERFGDLGRAGVREAAVKVALRMLLEAAQ